MTETKPTYRIGHPSPGRPPGDADRRADDVLDFIKEYKADNDGNSPTVREIMEGVGLSSTSVVVYYLNNLVERELITRLKSDSRSIQVVGGSWTYAG